MENDDIRVGSALFLRQKRILDQKPAMLLYTYE